MFNFCFILMNIHKIKVAFLPRPCGGALAVASAIRFSARLVLAGLYLCVYLRVCVCVCVCFCVPCIFLLQTIFKFSSWMLGCMGYPTCKCSVFMNSVADVVATNEVCPRVSERVCEKMQSLHILGVVLFLLSLSFFFFFFPSAFSPHSAKRKSTRSPSSQARRRCTTHRASKT